MNAGRTSALVFAALSMLVAVPSVHGTTGRQVQDRIDAEMAAGKPIVVHAVVALCDNANQGIVPVPAALGNGQDPRTNLYWGALYGLRTHFSRSAGWTRIEAPKPQDRRILERTVLTTKTTRGDASIRVYLIADAWDGAHIREATLAYLRMASGHDIETVEVADGSTGTPLTAGGAAHLLAYVGHNGLMDFSLDEPVAGVRHMPGAAVVLACASKQYFLEPLRTAGVHPLLLTTGLMAPEAYTLDAAIRSWVTGADTSAVGAAAAAAYDRYQKCGVGAARRLFWGAP